jgi:hypothetical protein
MDNFEAIFSSSIADEDASPRSWETSAPHLFKVLIVADVEVPKVNPTKRGGLL